jgi:hypothetical protein
VPTTGEDETDMASLLQQALRRKPVTELTAQTGTDTGGGELERSIGLFQL